MKDIVIASGNEGKIREIKHFLKPYVTNMISQKDFFTEAVAETGTTFVENAIIKARYAAKISGLPSIADDSGLCVDALGGAPGIFSARYAGTHADDAANISKLLKEMRSFEHPRQAYYYCCMVFLKSSSDPTPLVATGLWRGEILSKPQGEEGFGYDPIFFLPEYGLSAAELDLDEKNRISHRAKALTHLQAAFHETFTTTG